jgi:L-fuculose-phosphate aldolase
MVAQAYRQLGRSALVLGAEGSVAVAERTTGVLVVTAAGLVAEEATPDGVCEVDLVDGAHRSGPVATPQLPLHVGAAAAGHDASIVLRAPHATALALVCDRLPAVLADQALLVGAPTSVLRDVPLDPQALAGPVRDVLADGRRSVAVRHVGVVAAGPDLATALAVAVTVESAARAYLLARTLREPPTLDGPR